MKKIYSLFALVFITVFSSQNANASVTNIGSSVACRHQASSYDSGIIPSAIDGQGKRLNQANGCTTTVAIAPGGPITIGKGQSITFDAGSGFSTYSWLSSGTQKTVHFSIADGHVPERSNFVMTHGFWPSEWWMARWHTLRMEDLKPI